MFEERAEEFYNAFNGKEGITVVKPQGAFYASILFDDRVLSETQTLPISNDKVRQYIEKKVENVAPDKRFVYYLLASTGVCVVPLTGFCCDKKGFRVTLLECDDEKRRNTWKLITDSISTYLKS